MYLSISKERLEDSHGDSENDICIIQMIKKTKIQIHYSETAFRLIPILKSLEQTPALSKSIFSCSTWGPGLGQYMTYMMERVGVTECKRAGEPRIGKKKLKLGEESEPERGGGGGGGGGDTQKKKKKNKRLWV